MTQALVVGFISLLISLIGALFDPTRFFQSYLFSYLFWIDLPLGALTLIMIYHLTGGTWGAALRRIAEAAARTVPWMALLFLPILFGMNRIYPWLDPGQMMDPKLLHKAAYLNGPGFAFRAVLYFLVWILLNRFLALGSEKQRLSPSIETTAWLRSLSAGGLVAYVLTATFASFDWQMSLEPRWYSTIYGMVYCVGQGLQAFAFALIVFVLLCRETRLADAFPLKTRRDLGRLLLAMVMVWAYLAFMQFLVIWMGNLPEEATWFVRRTQGGWQILAILLIFFQFALPFSALLFRGTKDHLKKLYSVAALVFALRIIDHYWTTMPGLYPSGISLHWQDLTTFLGLGGIWLAIFLRALRSRPLFATEDADWPIPSGSEVTSHV